MERISATEPPTYRSGPAQAERAAENFRQYLNANGLKLTVERRAILEVLRDAQVHLCAEDVRAQVKRARLRVSLASIYRTLDLLVKSGMVRTVCGTGERQTYYEPVNRALPHGHLTCAECGAIEEFTEPQIEAVLRRVADAAGFLMTLRCLQIFGRCRRCQTRKMVLPRSALERLRGEVPTENVGALELAIAVEAQAREAYILIADSAETDDGRAAFEDLAALEADHVSLLRYHYHRLTGRDYVASGEAEWVTAAARTKASRRSAIEMALADENQVAELYRKLSATVTDPKLCEAFNHLAAQEEAHLEVLQVEGRELTVADGRQGKTNPDAP